MACRVIKQRNNFALHVTMPAISPVLQVVIRPFAESQEGALSRCERQGTETLGLQ